MRNTDTYDSSNLYKNVFAVFVKLFGFKNENQFFKRYLFVDLCRAQVLLMIIFLNIILSKKQDQCRYKIINPEYEIKLHKSKINYTKS
jgi:hypothetical protein